MGRSRPCIYSTAGVWLHISVVNHIMGSGAPASRMMSVIIITRTEGNALATSKRGKWPSVLCKSFISFAVNGVVLLPLVVPCCMCTSPGVIPLVIRFGSGRVKML